MEYWNATKTSFRQAWENLSLLAVLALEFVLMSLLGLSFFLFDNALVIRLNPGAVTAGSPKAFLNQVMNVETIVIMLMVLVAQAVIMTLIDSLFKAGFFGMVKNTLQDGSTRFREFVPEAKKVWKTMFGFQLLRYVILGLFGIPLVVASIQLAGTTPDFITPGQVLFFVAGILLFGVAWLLVTFFLIYGEAAIVFKQASVMEAFKRTISLVSNNAWFTLKLALTVLLIVIVAGIAESVVTLPFEFLAGQQPSWVLVADLANLVFGLITMFATVVIALIVFRGYREIAG